jgi:hypothetical protein
MISIGKHNLKVFMTEETNKILSLELLMHLLIMVMNILEMVQDLLLHLLQIEFM